MVITKAYAMKLIRAGKAGNAGKVYHDGRTYIAVDRYDLQRVDHYFLGHGDLR